MASPLGRPPNVEGDSRVKRSDPEGSDADAGSGGVLAGVLIGESVYGLTVIAGTTSPVYWWLQAGVGVLLVVTSAWSGPDPRALASAVIVSTVVAAAFGVLYSAA